jgi:hypothetical protein
MNTDSFPTTSNELSARISALTVFVHELRIRANSQIEASIEEEMYDWTKELADIAEKLKSIECDRLPRIHQFLEHALLSHLNPGSSELNTQAPIFRVLRVGVSAGMLRQNLLTLTEARKSGEVSLGEQFRVTVPDGSVFKTDLVEPGNRFRERSEVRKFYAANEVQEGDIIYLKEVQKGDWKLLTADSDEGKQAAKEVESLNRAKDISVLF